MQMINKISVSGKLTETKKTSNKYNILVDLLRYISIKRIKKSDKIISIKMDKVFYTIKIDYYFIINGYNVYYDITIKDIPTSLFNDISDLIQ